MPDTQELKRFAINNGASLVGVADLGHFRNYPTFPPDLTEPYTRAVSVAIALDDGVIDAIEQLPTVQYADHYRAVNEELNAIAEKIVNWIIEHGHKAHAVPASAFADPERLMGHISHKAVARMAGIGWQGKSLLIVTPDFGPRVRLVTVLTDMPLAPDGPIENRCGECTKCTEACPVGAIRCVLPAGEHYSSRDEAIDFATCNDRTIANNSLPGIGARVCGVCVRACPWGEK